MFHEVHDNKAWSALVWTGPRPGLSGTVFVLQIRKGKPLAPWRHVQDHISKSGGAWIKVKTLYFPTTSSTSPDRVGTRKSK